MTDDYNQRNQSQSTVWKYAKPLFDKAIQTILREHTSSTSFRVADWGCATGGNSIAPLRFVSDKVKEARNLEFFLGDLPSTAWSALVNTVTPETISSNPQQTFVYMVGRTFYECCAPNLDLSYCLVAVHWMKSYPANIPSGLYATDPLHNTDPDCLNAWREAGRRDFADFTRARYNELKVGGCFIGAVACPKENGDFPWSKVGILIHRALEKHVANPKDLASCVLPCCWRTEAEVRAGFDDDAWELIACEFHETKDPVRESLERGGISAGDYGNTTVEAFKAVCHPTCLGSLVRATGMPTEKVEALLNEAYNEAAGVCAADPEQYNLDVSFWYVLARKVK